MELRKLEKIFGEFYSRLDTCETEEHYSKVLLWGLKQYELSASKESLNFTDPTAAMIVEVYFRCPSAVRRCVSNKYVSRIYARLEECELISKTS